MTASKFVTRIIRLGGSFCLHILHSWEYSVVIINWPKFRSWPVCHETSAMMHHIRTFNMKDLPQLEQFSFWSNHPSWPWVASGLRFVNTHQHQPCKLPYTKNQLVAETAVYMIQNKHTKISELSGFRNRGLKQFGDFRTTNKFARLYAAADCWPHSTVYVTPWSWQLADWQSTELCVNITAMCLDLNA